MKRKLICVLAAVMMLVQITAVIAEPVFVTDQLQVGLHEDKTLDSPIITLVTSGTQLELIKREDNLSFVRNAAGVTGWIDNTYLIADTPASERLKTLTARFNALEQQMNNPQDGGASLPANTAEVARLSSENATLQQEFNSERLKVGELQVTIAELRKRLGQDNDAEALYREIDALQQTNKDLEIRLANAMGAGLAEGSPGTGTTGSQGALTPASGKLNITWKNLLIMVLLLVVIGLAAGIYLMDYMNRRRHGGFRI